MTKKNKFATFVAKTIPTVSNDMAKWYHESLVFESNVVAEGRVKRKTVEVSLKEGNTLPVDNINPVMSTANSGDTNPGIVAIDRRDGGKFVTTESSSIICNNTPVKETFDEKAAEGTLIPNKTKSSISITPRDHTPAEETFIDKAAGGTLILNKNKPSITMGVQSRGGDNHVIQFDCKLIQFDCDVIQFDCDVIQFDCKVIQIDCEVIQFDCEVI